MRPGRQSLRRFLIMSFFLLLPITLNYYSPYLMTSGTAAGVATFSLLFWGAVFATSLVLGRSFCGYACPFNGLQTAWERVSDKPTRHVRFVRWIKYALWGAWVVGVIAAVVAARGWHRVDLLYMTEGGVSITDPGNLITYFLLVSLTLAPTALGKRGFCHYLCPFGVWGVVGSRIGRALHVPMLHLKADPQACSQCRTCNRNCPMSLPVSGMVAGGDAFNTECTLCGSCVDGCKDGGVRYAFGVPARAPAPKGTTTGT